MESNKLIYTVAKEVFNKIDDPRIEKRETEIQNMDGKSDWKHRKEL